MAVELVNALILIREPLAISTLTSPPPRGRTQAKVSDVEAPVKMPIYSPISSTVCIFFIVAAEVDTIVIEKLL